MSLLQINLTYTEGFAPSDSLLVFPQASAAQYRIIATRFRVVEGESSGDFRILIDIQEPQQERRFRVQRGDLDPLLLIDQNGVIVAENDDISADDPSSRLV